MSIESKNGSGIPRILHQIWLGPRKPPWRWLRSVERMHSGWEYHLWTEGNLPPLHNQRAFDRSPSWHQKSDVLRYEILWRYGGVYVDADCEALRPLDPLLGSAGGLFAGYEGSTADPGLIASGVIGCAPHHPLMRVLIDELDIERDGHAWEIAGPLYFTEAIRKTSPHADIHPAHYFYPIHHRDRWPLYFGVSRRDPRLANSYFMHHWGSTTDRFLPWPRRLARRLRYAVENRRRSS